jgi:hypothetical protein
MAKTRYRIDSREQGRQGQTLGFVHAWGSRSLAAVFACRCADGIARNAYVTGEADTYFSQPAYVHVKGRRVNGWIGCDDELYSFHESPNGERIIKHLRPGDEASQASHRPVDLASGILSLAELRGIHLDSAIGLHRILSWDAVTRVRPDAVWDDRQQGESMDELINAAIDEMQNYCPEGHYFGMHEGDGSLLGVWQCDDL